MKTSYDFDRIIERRNTDSVKWCYYGEDVLSMWVADMDFPAPEPVLEAAFRRIQEERMQGIPLLNPALDVAAVGFTQWQGRWVGAMLTPWFLNLMMLPKDPDGWEPLGEGEKRVVEMPSGDYRFAGGFEESIGPYQFVSLLSPVTDIPDQASALSTARDLIPLLLTPTVDRGGARAPEPQPRDSSRLQAFPLAVGPEQRTTIRSSP